MTDWAGVEPKGGTPPTLRHADGQTETADASTFTFVGGPAPTGALILVKYARRYMGDGGLFGSPVEERNEP